MQLALVVEQALETSRPHLRGHEFTVVLPSQPIWVDADPVRLAQVLSNLLNNACKYTPDGGKIRLAAERAGPTVTITVSDDGIGIAAEQLPRLFNLFAQAAPAARRVQRGGLGIGLALARALVEMQGGTIEVASEGEGRGSRFTVTLPALDEGMAPLPPARPAKAAGAPRRILVVDDNRDSAASLAMLLRTDGHTIEVAHDGERAVQATVSFRPDAVLLDIGLPGMSGLDTCRAIRSQAGSEHILIAALTGWGQEEDRRRSREAGFDAHLVKPVAYDALVAFFASQRR
jgi:CheY-like chemotaxis protein/anti-sigma regulatory factor (Ser/Thr protein kinase)